MVNATMTNGPFPLPLACDNLTISHNMLPVFHDMVANTGNMLVLKRIDFNYNCRREIIRSR